MIRALRTLFAYFDIDLGTITLEEPVEGLHPGSVAYVLPGHHNWSLPRREVLVLSVGRRPAGDGWCTTRDADGNTYGWMWHEVVPMEFLAETSRWARTWIKRPEDLDILYTLTLEDREPESVPLYVILAAWRRRYSDEDVTRLYCRLVVAHPRGLELYPQPDWRGASPRLGSWRDCTRIYPGTPQPKNVLAFTLVT